MRNTIGYFFVASNPGGLTTKYCTGVPPAPGTVRLSGTLIDRSFSHVSFSRVRDRTSVPSDVETNTSAGAVLVDFENTSDVDPTDGSVTTPPFTISFGVPPASGTRYRLSAPLLLAMK